MISRRSFLQRAAAIVGLAAVAPMALPKLLEKTAPIKGATPWVVENVQDYQSIAWDLTTVHERAQSLEIGPFESTAIDDYLRAAGYEWWIDQDMVGHGRWAYPVTWNLPVSREQLDDEAVTRAFGLAVSGGVTEHGADDKVWTYAPE